MSGDTEPTAPEREPLRLSQETKAILAVGGTVSVLVVTVGIALATLMITMAGDIRDEGRAARAAWEAESRQLRVEAQAHRDAADAQARVDREAWERRIAEVTAQWRADREHFQSEIRRLTGETARLAARAEPE